MLSRGEFVERLYLIMDFARDNRFLDSSHVLNNIAVIEEFSGTPLPKIVLSALVKHSLGNDSAGVSFRLSEDKTLLLDHTTNKTYCVAKTHHDLENLLGKLLINGKLPFDEWSTNHVSAHRER